MMRVKRLSGQALVAALLVVSLGAAENDAPPRCFCSPETAREARRFGNSTGAEWTRNTSGADYSFLYLERGGAEPSRVGCVRTTPLWY